MSHKAILDTQIFLQAFFLNLQLTQEHTLGEYIYICWCRVRHTAHSICIPQIKYEHSYEVVWLVAPQTDQYTNIGLLPTPFTLNHA